MNVKYNLRNKSVNKLIELAQSGIKEAMDLILEKYYAMVVRIASNYFVPGAEFQDMIQNGLVGLIKAVYYFDGEKSSFNSFAWRSIESEIMTFLTHMNRKKNKILSEAQSFDGLSNDDDDSEQSFYFVEDKERNVAKDALYGIFTEEIEKNLKDMEVEIFNLWKMGYSYKEIEDELSVNFKKVDNTIQKIKKIARQKIDPLVVTAYFEETHH